VLAAGLGTGAIALGLLVGYLVNGPPQRLVVPRVADNASAAPASDVEQPGTIAAPAPAAPPPAAAAPAASAPSASPSADRVQAGTNVAPAPAAAPPAAAAPAAPAPSAAAAQMPAAEVREVQGRLRALGFNPGPVDGAVGPLTENAVKQYQRARGLEATGALDRNLLAQLRQEPPPPRRYSGNSRASNAAAAPRRPRNDFEDFFDRLFRR
jgi:hypothetical protein